MLLSAMLPQEGSPPHKPSRPQDIPVRYVYADLFLQVGLKTALRMGLTADSAEDCALAFVGRALAENGEGLLRPPAQASAVGAVNSPWLWRCALNHAIDYGRQQACQRSHEAPWSSHSWSGDDGAIREVPDCALCPETLVLRRECLRVIFATLEEFGAAPRKMFVKHHLLGQTVVQIAAASGRTPHAIEQALLRVRRRLRELLQRQEWGEAQMRLYLAPPPLDANGHTKTPDIQSRK